MPMYVCYILLERLWQYDRHALHDGRKNIYTIVANGMKQTLFPLEETYKSDICANVRIFLVDGQKILDGLRNEIYAMP